LSSYRMGAPMSEADHSSEHQASLPSHTEDRLDSWKEIAAFLERDVRTVQRWEKFAGLPVHRHAEPRLRTAYAYRSELEAWWRMQRSTVEPGGATDVPIVASSRTADATEIQPARGQNLPPHRLRALSALGIFIIVAITAASWLRSAPDAPPASTADQPVAVVVARFEDRAEQPDLASAIQEAVARELTGSGHLEMVTPARIARTLRLMRRDPTAPLDQTLGRELAVRYPRIKYVIAGRVHTFEAKYFADVRALDAEGRSHATVEWQAATTEQLISQSRDVLGRFAQLMARSVAKAVKPVELPEEVTSSSTAAVGLYTAALQAALRGQWGASELLARRAIVLDPDFAAAHAWVGWAMRRQGRSTREALPSLERALLLSRDVTDEETYLVSGMFHSVAGDLRGAAAALEALRRLNPSHRQALDMLIEVFWRMGRVRRAVELSVVRGEAYPATSTRMCGRRRRWPQAKAAPHVRLHSPTARND
jgi:tetratricopeptide (TPR) repeat protein